MLQTKLLMTGWYWGPKLRIVLASITTDASDPRGSKRLVFSISGEQIDSGQRIDIEVGGRGGNYGRVAPNTAVRSDSQGTFVLFLDQKKTPPGTRYITRRVEVNVTAKDDVNSAITGGIGNWDYVITLGSSPVSPGQYVRLAD